MRTTPNDYHKALLRTRKLKKTKRIVRAVLAEHAWVQEQSLEIAKMAAIEQMDKVTELIKSLNP